MTLELFDLVLVLLIVLAAAAYMVWKLFIRSRPPPPSQARLGGTLSRGLERARREREKTPKSSSSN